MIVDIRIAQDELEGELLQNQTFVEEKAVKLHAESSQNAAAILTKHRHNVANKVMQYWKQLGPELLMKYMNGNVRDETGTATHPPYPAALNRRIVDEVEPALMVTDAPLENVPRVGPANSTSCAKHVDSTLPATSAVALHASASRLGSRAASTTASEHSTLDNPSSRSTSCTGCFACSRGASARASLFFVSAVVALFAARKRHSSRQFIK